jgi:hypothetical protein
MIFFPSVGDTLILFWSLSFLMFLLKTSFSVRKRIFWKLLEVRDSFGPDSI